MWCGPREVSRMVNTHEEGWIQCKCEYTELNTVYRRFDLQTFSDDNRFNKLFESFNSFLLGDSKCSCGFNIRGMNAAKLQEWYKDHFPQFSSKYDLATIRMRYHYYELVLVKQGWKDRDFVDTWTFKFNKTKLFKNSYKYYMSTKLAGRMRIDQKYLVIDTIRHVSPQTLKQIASETNVRVYSKWYCSGNHKDCRGCTEDLSMFSPRTLPWVVPVKYSQEFYDQFNHFMATNIKHILKN
ncbi:hypothetical protein [Carp edema virus]|nr:hypothetical protein [Carp edema virus]